MLRRFLWVTEAGDVQRSNAPIGKYLCLHSPIDLRNVSDAKLLDWIRRSHPAFLKPVKNPMYPPADESKEDA